MATVLVVDDDRDLCEALCELCEDEGFTALAAYDAMEALAISERNAVDVVLSDLNMPIMNGVELYRRIAERDTIPLFVLTSTSRPRDWPLDRLFLAKPIDFDRLVRLVRTGA
jgi:CheY-like chemotaxis protein